MDKLPPAGSPATSTSSSSGDSSNRDLSPLETAISNISSRIIGSAGSDTGTRAMGGSPMPEILHRREDTHIKNRNILNQDISRFKKLDLLNHMLKVAEIHSYYQSQPAYPIDIKEKVGELYSDLLNKLEAEHGIFLEPTDKPITWDRVLENAQKEIVALNSMKPPRLPMKTEMHRLFTFIRHKDISTFGKIELLKHAISIVKIHSFYSENPPYPEDIREVIEPQYGEVLTKLEDEHAVFLDTPPGADYNKILYNARAHLTE